MIKHVLLMAVLEEMDRLAVKLRSLTEAQPDGWQELYTSYRRQLNLCITEIVKLAQDDLPMNKVDLRRLQGVMDKCLSALASHQARYPVESLSLNDPAYLASFALLHKVFLNFKTLVTELVNRYQIAPELVS